MRPAPLSFALIAPVLLAACADAADPAHPASRARDRLPAGVEVEPQDCTPGSGSLPYQDEAEARGLTVPLGFPGDSGYPGDRGSALVARDLDADGDVDLLAGRARELPVVYENDGSGRFSIVEQALSLPIRQMIDAEGLSAVDLDGDGLPELVVGSSGVLAILRHEGDLVLQGPEFLMERGHEGHPVGTVTLADLDGDRRLDAVLPTLGHRNGDQETPVPDDLFLSGGGALAWVGEVDPEAIGSRTRVALLTDLDGDLLADILLANDLGPPTAAWVNQGPDGEGGLVLENDAAALGIDMDMAAMGVATHDLDGDGQLDICLSDIGPTRCLLRDAEGRFYEAGRALGTDPATAAHERFSTVGWSIELEDLDNDGYPELIQASGPEPWMASQHPDLVLPDLVHSFDGERFTDVSAELGFDDPTHHYALATADFDDNGALDIVVGGGGAPPKLYLSPCTDGGWLNLDLEGVPENRDAYGARVEVEAGGRIQLREVQGTRALGQGPPTLHFGLGELETIDRLRIRWPDGEETVIEDLPARSRVSVLHPGVAG